MYFEIYPTPATPPGVVAGAAAIVGRQQWRWRLRAANHEIIAQGESYTDRRNCEHAVNLLKQTTFATPVRMVQG